VATTSDSPRAAPASPWALFWACTRLALQGFGGVLPVAQRELVERQGWLSREQFLAYLSAGQVLPGPNIINLALMMGDRFFGWRGALAAAAGLLVLPLCIVLLAAALYGQFHSLPWVAGALKGMGAVAAGLVVGTGLKLARSLRHNPMGLVACTGLVVCTALAVGLWRWPLPVVVLGLGVPAIAWAWWRQG
jgi:chromate transporter